jgi:hypothetical protein
MNIPKPEYSRYTKRLIINSKKIKIIKIKIFIILVKNSNSRTHIKMAGRESEA